MATTARLGIDIIATDRTRAAFMSTQRSMAGIDRSLRQVKGAFAGLVGGNILAGVVRSLVEVNRHTEPVKTSLTLLARAWQDFALRVGSGGLNEALVKFVTRIGEMLVGSNHLASVLGNVLSAVLTGMTKAFEVLGRTIGFVYDNFQTFKNLLLTFLAIEAAAKILQISVAFVKMVSAIRAASLATALFHLIQRRMLLLWVAIITVGAKLTGQFDKLKAVINQALEWAGELIPTMGEGVIRALQRMGLDVTSLTEDFSQFNGQLKALPQTFAELEAGAKAMKPFESAIRDLAQYVEGIRAQTAAVGKSEGAIARLAASQEFYNKMQDRGIKLTAEQRAQVEGLLNEIPDAIANLNAQRSNFEMLQEIGESFASSMVSAFTAIVDGSKSVGSAIKDMVKNIVSSLTQLFLNKAFEVLLNGRGGGGGILGSIAGGLGFGGGKAAGGPVSPGKAYVVGEKGPEMFVTGTSGAIIPNGRGGGGGVTIIDQRSNGANIERKKDSRGNQVLILRDAVRSEIANFMGGDQGSKLMNAKFGLSPSTTRR